MLEPGDVLDVPTMGVRVEVREASEERCQFDVVGRARGMIAQAHCHTAQTEHHEVLEGELRLVIGGTTHLLRPGESMTVPRGVSHRQLPGGTGAGRVRVTLHPGGDTPAFLERLAELDRDGQLVRGGFPRPVAAARFVADFSGSGHASFPPLRVQLALARMVLALADREYVFVDEWDVAAPREAVFAALADSRSYPRWWRPVYLDVTSDGEPARVGAESHQHFKGRLPYHLRTRSRITRVEAPAVLEADVDGDLRGHGTWTLTDTGGGTHVRFDWRVFADRPLLRLLTPLLRPALRWNHAWAIARAREGLEPYARELAAAEERRPSVVA
jgi:uncharacterized protein YndB with AHSA1/START domain/mannose-6-phosphate isomerase-like protein (cupin superfamily)